MGNLGLVGTLLGMSSLSTIEKNAGGLQEKSDSRGPHAPPFLFLTTAS